MIRKCKGAGQFDLLPAISRREEDIVGIFELVFPFLLVLACVLILRTIASVLRRHSKLKTPSSRARLASQTISDSWRDFDDSWFARNKTRFDYGAADGRCKDAAA
jgi:hypothetical protein